MKLSDLSIKWADSEAILDCADILGLSLDLRASDPMEKAAEKYSKAVLANIEPVLRKLGYSELLTIAHLICGKHVSITKDTLYPTSVSLFLLDYMEDKGICDLQIPSDLADAATPILEKIISDQSYVDASDRAQFIMGMVNTYGMIRKQELIHMLAATIGKELKDEELTDIGKRSDELFWATLEDSAELGLAIDDTIPAPEGDFWLVSPYVEDTRRVLEDRLMHDEFTSYKEYPFEQFFDAGDAMFPILPNRENDALLRFLSREMKMDTDEAESNVTRFWLRCQDLEFRPTELIQAMAKACHDGDTLSNMMERMTAFSKACPRWGLKGHTLLESDAQSHRHPADEGAELPPFYKRLVQGWGGDDDDNADFSFDFQRHKSPKT